jgi:hypothetical protein
LKTTQEMKSQNNYVNWNFTNVWGINENTNGGFPFLRTSVNVGATSIVSNSVAKRAAEILLAGIKNGQINLKLMSGSYTVELCNLQGRIISKVDINAVNGVNATGLRINGLAKGVFVLNVKQSGVSILSQKIAVK